MAADPLRTAWYPPERSRMILNRNDSIARNRPGLSQSQKLAIGFGTTAGILVLIGIILGAVLGTQLKKPQETNAFNLSYTTEAPTTISPTPVANEVQLDTQMTLDNITFTNDLKDPNSEAYKKLANQICDEMKKAMPQDEVDEIDCSNIEFSPGSVVVRFVFKVIVKKTVTVSKASFGNLIQSWVKLRFTGGKSSLQAKKDSFKFQNLGICNPNPCKYSGKCIDVGGGEFKCQCKPGKYGKTCDDDPTFCTCSGDPHCKTFDKLAMDYQGTCKFVLSEARDKSFTVYSRNINIKGVKRVSWARYIELKYNNLVVRMGKLDPYNIKKPNAVWVNGVQVNLPYQKEDVNIYKQGQTLVCRTKFGLMLTYGKWQARVGLTSKFKNKVTGFCGNFDGNKKNDASTSSGEYVFQKKNFGNIIGNSYIVQDTEKQPYSASCKLSDNEVGSSACPGVDLKKALFLCQQIKNPTGKFKACVKALKLDDVSDFSSWCDFDVKQTCDATVATAAVTTFVESCFEFDYTLVQNVLDWKKEFNITKDDEFDDEDNCTGGTTPSTSGCQNTCDNQNATMLCDLPDVVGSCSCPSGTFSFKDNCVTQAMCGCIHTDGSAHFINETWLSEDCSKKFTCSEGGKISTSLNSCRFGKTCVRSKCSACNPVNPCKNGGTCMDIDVSPGYKCQCSPGYLGPLCASSQALCQCFGDPHCITFDGLPLDYQGTRKHKLVEWMGDQKNLPFTIFGKNINLRGSTKVSFMNMVELSYNDMLIRMTKAYKSSVAPIIVTVNYEEVEIPYTRNNLTILRKGRFVELNNNRGLLVSFSSNWQFKVKLSADFFGKNVTGLCGNYDGITSNDKKKADGNLAAGNTSFSWGRDLGDSFIVQNDTEDDEKLATPTDSTPPDCPPTVLETAKLACTFIISMTGPFSKCISNVASYMLQQMYDWCMFDVKMTCDASLSLDSLTVLSDICSKMDIIVDWRAVLKKQPCQCPIEEMSCSGLAPSCIPSCQDPLAAENCSLPQVQDLCTCPPGKVLFQDRCVFVSECGCIDERGKSRQIGETWLTPDCKAFECVRPNVIESQTPACPGNATCKDGRCVAPNAQCSNNTCDAIGGKCVLNGKGLFSCMCKPGFTGNRCQYRESTCQCKGDIHCQTFDGLYLDYQGLCKFVLVNSTDADYPFTVYGKNVVRFQKPRVSWILFGEIHFNGSIIKIGRNSAEDKKIKIQIDGVPVTVSQAWFPSFQVYKTGKYHVFQSRDKKLQVFLGKDWTIKIVLAGVSSGKVEGFCGNNNKLRNDDNKLRNGTTLAEVNVKKSGKLIGDSYVVADPDVTNVSTCVQPATPSNPPPCSASESKRAASTCGAISDPKGVFAVCFQPGNHSSNVTNVSEDFNITLFKEWCDFDFNETCQFEAVDTAVSVFAQMCIDEAIMNNNLTVMRNVSINSTVVEKEFETEVVDDIEIVINFRSELNLTVTCEDPNSIYAPSSTGCPATCENPNAPEDCLLPDVYDACVCPIGFLLFQDLCILPADCGCVQNNSAYLVGESWMTNKCTVNNTCLKDVNGSSIINSTSTSCPAGKQCTADNTCSACQPVSPCKNGAKCEDGINSSSALFICKCPPGFAGVDCGQVLRPFGSCYFFGNGHLITFDGLPLNLNTTCKVMLVQTSDFSVSLKSSSINGITTFSYLEVVMTTVKVKLSVEQNASLLVYVNDSFSVEPPYNSSYFELKYIGEFIEFNLQNQLIILFSESGFEIKLSLSLKGKTKGVCGDYNDVISDDLKTSSGLQIALPTDGWAGENETRRFVESFQDANDTKSCSLPRPIWRPSCSFDVLSLGDKCKEILNPQGPLKDCLANVNSLVLNVTLNWCLSDVRDTCDDKVAGVNIRFIYDRCFQVSTKPLPPPLCDLLKLPTCPCAKPNTSFMPKSSACPASCKTPDQPSRCLLADLVNVCGCSDGFLLFKGRCVPSGSCGCFDEKGRSHDIGEVWLSDTCTVKYTCASNGSISEEPYTCNKTCNKGVCTACTNPSQCVGGKCYDTNNDPGYFCRCNPGLVGNGLSCRKREAGFCSVYGDPHYISFDNQYFDYQGTAKYVLVDSLDNTRPIRILCKNVPVKGKSKVSVLDYAEILFKNKTFKLQRAYDGIFAPVVAKVNDDLLGIPFNSNDGSFNISYFGDTLRFSTNIGVTVAFMPMYRANVEAAIHFKNNLTGLCGNFDGSSSNDLQANGRDVTFLPDPGNAFGNSFVVENETSSSGPVFSPDVTPPTPCLNDISAYRVRCQDMGSPDGPFGDCVKGMNPMEVQVAKDNCLFDLEQTCSSDSVKIAFLTFARKCFHSFGAKVEKVKELECECTEPYTTCMATSSGCPATCSNPSSPDTCPLSDSIFVCACEAGRLLFNGKCVLPDECGCIYTDGRAFKIGETWLSEDCLLKLTCTSPNVYNSDLHNCTGNKTCVSGTCRACTKDPCGSNGECIETTSSIGYVCRCKPGFYGPTCSIAVVSGSYTNSHCVTFDKATYDFKGSGEFTLVRSSGVTSSPLSVPFEIRVTNVFLGDLQRVSYAKRVTIIIMSYTFTFEREGEGLNAKLMMKINNLTSIDLPYKANDFEVNIKSFASVTFISKTGVGCSYDASESSVTVSLPTTYMTSGGISGLLGNFDGNPDNDLITADGRNVSNSTDPGNDVGISYTNMSSPEFRNISNLPPMPSCQNNLQPLLDKCKQLSSLSGPLRPLVIKLGISRSMALQNNCVSDVRRSCSADGLCAAVKRMTEAVGIDFDWRTAFACEVKCPDGFEPKPRASGCLPSCKDPMADRTCTLPDVMDGCTCSANKLFFKGRCVDRSQCGCIDNSTGKSYEIGQTWRSDGCQVKLTCSVGGNITSEDAGGCAKGVCLRNRCSGCQVNPCTNGGTCLDVGVDGDYVCKCPSGFYGRRCDGMNYQADVTILIEDGISSCRGNSDTNLQNCIKNFTDTVKNFLKTFVDGLVIGPDDVRVSMVTFSSKVTVAWPLKEYSNVTTLKDAIDFNLNITYNKDESVDLTNALQSIINLINSPDLQRVPKLKILVLLTDGGSEFDATSAPTSAKNLADARIGVCGVGLSSKVRLDVLQTICSEPKKFNYNYYPYVGNVSVNNLKEAIKLKEPVRTKPLNELTATCRCSGDPHCKTFDGQVINYQGTCKILMASNRIVNATRDFPPFSLFLKSYHRGGNTRVSWVELTEFVYNGVVVKFQRAGEFGTSQVIVTVGGRMVNVPYSDGDFTIDYRGNFVELQVIGSQVKVAYSSRGITFITLPDQFSRKVFGLCGNYDGNVRNDLKTRNGADVSGKMDPGKEIGDSYIEYYDADNAALLANCKPPMMKNQTCLAEAKPWIDKCKQLTNSSGVFKDCLSRLPSVAQDMQADCLFDLEQTCDYSSVELSIAQFAAACMDAGVFVEEWRGTLDLPCVCPRDKVCLPKGSPCLPTLSNPDRGVQCPFPDTTDVCSCSVGKVLFNGICVDPEQAGCIDGVGGARKLKESWLSDDCKLLYTCTSSNNISSEIVSCPYQTTCINGKCSACLHSFPCQNGGLCVEPSECQPKSLSNPGCYWMKVPNAENSITSPAPLNTNSLSACFQSCLSSSSPCAGINWLPSAPLGQQCLLVSSLSIPTEENLDSTQYLWVCSDQPCAAKSSESKYKCACKRGFLGSNCETSLGTCTLSVRAGLETFDGQSLFFRSNCNTTLVKSKNSTTLNKFAITVKNSQRNSMNEKFSQPRILKINFRGKDFRIEIPDVGVPRILPSDGDATLSLSPPFKSSDFSINFVGGDLELQTAFGLTIACGSSGSVKIRLPPDYAGQVEGLCGDFDGDKNNDGNVTLFDPGNFVSKQYFVPDVENPSDVNCSVVDLTSTTMTSTTNKQRCQAITDTNGPFRECLAKLDMMSLVRLKKSCELEVDISLTELAACASLEKLLDWCNRDANVILSTNWRTILGCKCSCADGFICVPRASGCPATCSNPNASLDCLNPDIQDACVCPPGKVLSVDRCVSPEQCGCVDNNGRSRQASEQWLNEDCTIRSECQRDGHISTIPNNCTQGSICSNSMCSVCSVKNPCKKGVCKDVEGGGPPICRCPPGFVGKNCEIDNNNTCQIYGNGHCHTFDGMQLDYGGDCKITLVKSIPPLPTFKVLGKNYRLKRNVFFLKYIEIILNEDTVRFEQTGSQPASNIDVMLNKRYVELPVKLMDYTIQYKGQKVELQTNFGLTATFHNAILSLAVPSLMSGNLKGLCGNFNGDKSDEKITAGGKNVSSGQEVADSYIVLDPDSFQPNLCLPMEDREPPQPPPTPPPQDVVSTTMSPPVSTASPITYPPWNVTSSQPNLTCQTTLVNEISLCKQLSDSNGIFGPCLKTLNNIMPLIADKLLNLAKNCEGDISSYCDGSVLSGYFSNMAITCSELGFTIDWVSILNTSYICPMEGMMYQTRPSSPCISTCSNPKASKACPWSDMTGICSCQPGFVLHNKKCIPLKSCGCVTDAGETYNVGSIWFEDNCTVKKTCVGAGNIKAEAAEGTCSVKCPSSSSSGCSCS